MMIICIHCQSERPTGDAPCPHCHKPPYPHKTSQADWQALIAERLAANQADRRGER